jgi:rhodanese-related sulfurtransferase
MPIPRISRDDLKARLDAGTPPTIVDARLKYPYEHSTLQLPGAIRLPPGSTDFSIIPPGHDIVVYDSDPDEIVSAPVVAALIDRGRTAMALAGGLSEWVAASFPTELRTGAVPPPTPTPAAAAKA